MLFPGGENISEIVKDKLTTTLNYVVKRHTKIILDSLGIGWNEFLHDACMELLKRHDAKVFLEIEFAEQNEKLANIRTSARETEENIQNIQNKIVEFKELPTLKISSLTTNQPNDANSILNPLRIALFEPYKIAIYKHSQSNSLSRLDLKRFELDGDFKNKKDVLKALREYISIHETEIENDGQAKLLEDEPDIETIRSRLFNRHEWAITNHMSKNLAVKDLNSIQSIMENGKFANMTDAVQWVEKTFDDLVKSNTRPNLNQKNLNRN